ncbi:hypothetical protein [Rhizobium sp. Root1203]|uniref:hypothetical protein n=1 Tax=Rhizobium sp. Root1203 TaxID=1736427 RepID=UPI0012E3DB3E|nr:hypothetical protein [Rhizobium sp. Root1203]
MQVAIATCFTALLLLLPSGCTSPPAGPLLDELYARFNPERPGFGVVDYPGNQEADVPKAYARILIAEVDRKRNGYRPDLPDLSRVAGRWLLDHADEDADGVKGWGVPVAWDAYGDGSVNPANSVYTISTAIAVDALLNWMELDPEAPGEEILATVTASLLPFTAPEMRSPSGMIPYSVVESDRKYDTFNPAAYMAGQMQRFSRITPNVEFAKVLASTADETVEVLLKQKLVNPKTGSWYWHYSIQESIANDLPHASYIIDGLIKYETYGGRRSADIDLKATLSHLREFDDSKRDYVRAWPWLQEGIDRSARSYDIGMAMSLACSNADTVDLGPIFERYIPRFRDGSKGYLKYPVGDETADPLIVNEYEAYLYQGVIACDLARSRGDTKVTAVTPPNDANVLLDKPVLLSAEVPFVSFAPDDQSGATRVKTTPGDPSSFMMVKSGTAEISFDPGEIPIATDALGDGKVVFVRHIGQNTLTIEYRDAEGRRVDRRQVVHAAGRSEPMFRAATTYGNRLYLVYYDNFSVRNFATAYELNAGRLVQVMNPVELPSLEDPAGGTYEMIPAIFLLPRKNGIEIVGGVLSAQLHADGTLESTRINDCVRAIEAVSTPDGPAVLCHRLSRGDNVSRYFISAPRSLTLPSISPNAVPFHLEYDHGELSVQHARTPADFAAMFTFDLERIQQNGWMEFGVGNVEARIPWSQIYYLNGFLDLLKLSKEDGQMRNAFEHLVPKIRERLDLEVYWLGQHWKRGNYQTRAFTVDRSPALFAVQTSRLLLLLDRYLKELDAPTAISADTFQDLREAVHCLRDHIDVLAYGGELPHWMAGDRANLRWPKGSKFKFDGLAVPFNHQNEWAYSVIRTGTVQKCSQAPKAAQDIITHFVDHIAPSGILPNSGIWNYWWGTAYDGWTKDEGISVNYPEYTGDKSRAWISFKTIDTMSLLGSIDALPVSVRGNVLASAAHLIQLGRLYPFAAYELQRRGYKVNLDRDVALDYSRVSSPWELQNAVWAYRALLSEQ